jgi:hypothetical protein
VTKRLNQTGKTWSRWTSIWTRPERKDDPSEIGAPQWQAWRSPWWTQMITVTYEQARAGPTNMKPEGYEISVSAMPPGR